MTELRYLELQELRARRRLDELTTLDGAAPAGRLVGWLRRHPVLTLCAAGAAGALIGRAVLAPRMAWFRESARLLARPVLRAVLNF